MIPLADKGKLDEPNNFTRRWNKFLEQNGIRQLKFHGLKHTCATMLLKNNVDIKTISNRYLKYESAYMEEIREVISDIADR